MGDEKSSPRLRRWRPICQDPAFVVREFNMPETSTLSVRPDGQTPSRPGAACECGRLFDGIDGVLEESLRPLAGCSPRDVFARCRNQLTAVRTS
jgi:hypothetical protein